MFFYRLQACRIRARGVTLCPPCRGFLICLVLSVLTGAVSVNALGADLNLSLTFLQRHKVRNKRAGLTELSGLALTSRGSALWTISDDTEHIFGIDLKGEIEQDMSFPIDSRGLEGICVSPTHEFLFAVDEDSSRILKFDIQGRSLVQKAKLSELRNFDTIAEHFNRETDNKGLEGIAYNTKDDTIVVVKEGQPGLLIQISSDLRSITASRLLTQANGFADDDTDQDDLDFSGLCYDAGRNALWIVSDVGQRLYLYDLDTDHVLQSFALGFGKNGKFQSIKKAEGVAYNAEESRLYIVSDKDGHLYVFDLR